MFFKYYLNFFNFLLTHFCISKTFVNLIFFRKIQKNQYVSAANYTSFLDFTAIFL